MQLGDSHSSNFSGKGTPKRKQISIRDARLIALNGVNIYVLQSRKARASDMSSVTLPLGPAAIMPQEPFHGESTRESRLEFALRLEDGH